MKRLVTVWLLFFALATGGWAQNVFSGRNHVFGHITYLGDTSSAVNAKVIAGTDEAPAQLLFTFENRATLRVLSRRFVIKENSIASTHTSARIYLYDSIQQVTDSIYHNDLGFRYNADKDQVMLYRKDGGVASAPFHDTYHGYDIYLEAIYWNCQQGHLEFRRLEGTSGESEGLLTSVDYFRKSDYHKMQALDKVHPMERLNQFLKLYGDDHHGFFLADYVAYVKYPPSQVLSQILTLQAEGCLEYDKETKHVTVLDRFYNVLASAHSSYDFDVIKFQTRTTGKHPNIQLALRTCDMMVYGIRDYQSKVDVPVVTLSDFKHVVILPDDATLVMKRDRSFKFSGCVMAGMYEFFGTDCLFNYETFSIEMDQIDSLRFYARFDGKVLPVEGALERLAGELKIDESDNKSSTRETAGYPSFNCPGNAYRFYRAFNEDFYYSLDPFFVGDLDNLNSQDVAFKGRLVSDSIFPDIVEPLVVMDDHSLGFRHVIGNGQNDSYPAYGGKGRFHQTIHLSNEGFYGIGQLDVATAAFTSERFDFYSDSVVAETQALHMRESAGTLPLPNASCGPMDIRWDVRLPQLYAVTKDEPIRLYDSTYFTGTTWLSDQGFGGDGTLTFGLTRFDSEHFDFANRSFVADSSRFVLYDRDGSTRAFTADNYRSHVDMGAKTVRYEYLDEESHLDFPLNKFYCSLNQAQWDMASNIIHLSGAPSEFVSLLPEHDSLSFLSTNADYNMNDYVVHAHGVDRVHVADVAIVPWNGTVDIQRDAAIKPLEHARIVADTATEWHVFKDAAVSIYSRHDYSALGFKDYVDADGVATPVFFHEIKPVDSVTVAYAEVSDSLDFMLSPYFGFKGVITSTATEPFDHYEGFVRLEQSCLDDTVWFATAAEIDPETVRIPIDMDKVRKERQGLFNGLCYEFGSHGGYHLNMMKPMNPETMMVTTLNGAISYDREQRSYIVEDEDNTMTLNDRCIVTMHGTSDLGFDMGLAEFACQGDFVNYPNDSMMIKVSNVFNAPVFDDQALADIAAVYAAIEGDPVSMTQEQPQTIVIPSLTMAWNPNLRAFVSVGKIGLGSLGGHVVNRYVDGYVMFDRRLGVITYFFKDDLFMTYLSYNCGDGQLQVHATYGTVNTRVADLRQKARSVRSDQISFEYVVTPYEALTGFLSRLKRAGIQ